MSDMRAILVLAALGHELRFGLWRLLAPFGPKGLPAGVIAARMEVLPSSLSFHLRQMTQAGLLIQRRSSRQIIYAVDQHAIEDLVACLATPTPVKPAGVSLGLSSDLVGD